MRNIYQDEWFTCTQEMSKVYEENVVILENMFNTPYDSIKQLSKPELVNLLDELPTGLHQIVACQAIQNLRNHGEQI